MISIVYELLNHLQTLVSVLVFYALCSFDDDQSLLVLEISFHNNLVLHTHHIF